MCRRCQRLRKDCVYLNISEARRKPKDNTRFQKLEERLEELVSQISNINNSQTQPSTPTTSAAQTTPFGKPFSTALRYDGPLPLSGSGSTSNSASHVPSWSEAAPIPSLLHGDNEWDVVDRGLLTQDCARTLFDTFRYSYMNYFPFVILPPETTVESLRREKPFLFLSIMAVAVCGNFPLQRILGKEIQKQIATRIVMRNEKTMDILQGLLVHIAYYHYFFSKENQQIYLMVQLSLTLIYELGLHHPARTKRFEEAPTEWGKMGSAERYGERTAQEIRTFLGIFVLSDDIAKLYRKQNMVCDQEFVLQCCQQLVKMNERPTDRWIQRYVQLNMLSQKISDTFSYYNPKNSKIIGEASICTMVDTFKRDLEYLKQGIRADALEQEASLLREVQFLDIWIHEVAFHDILWESPNSDTSTAANPIPSARVDMLWHCLTAAKVCATNFLDIPRVQIFQLPFHALSKICYVVIIFCKIVFFHVEKDFTINETDVNSNPSILSPSKIRSDASWDAVLATSEGEIYHIGSALQEKFAALVPNTGSNNGERDAMWHFAFFMKRIMAGYERRMKKSNNSPAQSERQQLGTGDSGHNNNRNTSKSSIQEPPSITAYTHTPEDKTIDYTNRAPFDPHMMDMGASTLPFDIIGSNVPLPEWVQNMAWEPLIDDIMTMPVSSW
ncbi:hypothetical protein B7463_g797, partial [Scytalidium lignicola]